MWISRLPSSTFKLWRHAHAHSMQLHSSTHNAKAESGPDANIAPDTRLPLSNCEFMHTPSTNRSTLKWQSDSGSDTQTKRARGKKNQPFSSDARAARWPMDHSFIYLFIEGLQPCQPHRITSGLFTNWNMAQVAYNKHLDYMEYNTKHAHHANVKHINIIRKLVPSVLLS